MTNTDTTNTFAITEYDDDSQDNEVLRDLSVEGAPRLTRQMKADIRKASAVVIRFYADDNAPVWGRDRAIVNVEVCSERRYQDGSKRRIRTVYQGFRGRISAGYASQTVERKSQDYSYSYSWTEYSKERNNLYAPTSGCVVYTTAAYNRELQTAFQLAPTDAELEFNMGLDSTTHAKMAAVGLHGDALTMVATRRTKAGKEQRFSFDVHHDVNLHDTSRFGWNSPQRKWPADELESTATH